MNFANDAQRRAVFAKIYPSWIRQDLNDRQKDIIMRYKNRLDANKIPYDIIEGEPVPVAKQIREIEAKRIRWERGLDDDDDNDFARDPPLVIKDGYVSLVPFNRIIDPTVGLGYHPHTLKRWLEELGGKPVPPIILRPAFMDPSRYSIWDGRHRYAAMEMEGRKHIPARIYIEGKLVYPKTFKREKFDGDETTPVRLGEEYKYLW